MFRGWGWLFLAFSFAIANATAAPQLDASFSSSGSTDLNGVVDADGTGLLLEFRGIPDLSFQAIERVHVVNIPYEVVHVTAPGLRPLTGSRPLPDEAREHPISPIVLKEGPTGSFVRIIPTTGAFSLTSGGFSVLPPGSVLESESGSSFAMIGTVLGTSMLADAGSGILVGHVANATFPGQSRTIIAGPTVFMGGKNFETGPRLNASRSTYDETTRTGRQVFDNWFVVVDAVELTVSCGCTSQAAWTELTGALEGTAMWRGVVGTPDLDGQNLASDPNSLEVTGHLQWDVRAADDMTWTVHGPVDRYRLDLIAWTQEHPVPVAGIGGLVALALLKGRDILTLLLGRVTPRLVKAKLESSSTRRNLLTTIQEGAPATLADLARRTGLDRGVLRYHLRILEAHAVIHCVLPPGHARRARLYGATGKVPAGSIDLAVAQAHPLRKAIYHAVKAEPLDYAGIVQVFREAGATSVLPQATASYHLARLQRAGLVAATWVDGRKVFSAADDMVSLRLVSGQAREEIRVSQ